MNNETLTSKTLSGLIWKFIERFSAQIISFIVSVILARMLFPEDYGIVALVTIFITLANSLVTNGIGTSLVQKKDSDSDDFSTMFWASVVLSLFLYLLLYLSAPLISSIYDNDLLIQILRVMGLILPISAVKSIQQAYISKNMIFKKFFISTLFGTIISGIAGITLAFFDFGVWALVSQYLTNAIISTIVLMFVIKWKPKFFFSKKKFKELFSFGWKIMSTSFIGVLFNEIRSLAIGYKYSSSDLAYYNKGEQIPNLVVNNINDAIESVTFPAFAQIQDNTEKMKEKTKEMISLSSFVLMPILFGIAAVAEPLTIILFTEKWIPIIPFIQVACIGKLFSIVTTLNVQAIKAKGKSDVLLKLEFIKKPVYLLFIIVGILISPLAVAIANMIYSFIAIIINTAPNKKYLNYSIAEQLKDMGLSLAFSVSMFVIVFIVISVLNLSVYLELIIGVSLGVVIYFLLTLQFQKQELNKSMKFIKMIFGKRGEINE